MTTTAMEYASAGERAVARKLVRNLLSRGLSVSVNDGEEWTVVRSRKEHEILGALATTELDELIAAGDAGERKGWFQLIWGNEPSGECLIADHSSNQLCETVWREVTGG
jgi:hypothetical protein